MNERFSGGNDRGAVLAGRARRRYH